MRGKIKFATLALMLSMLVPIFAVMPAFAPGPEVIADTIVNPLYGPGSTFSIDITFKNNVNLWAVQFDMDYNPAVLTATGAVINLASPVRFTTLEYTIDDVAGVIHLNITRTIRVVGATLGFGDNVTTVFNIPAANTPLWPGTDKVYLGGVATTDYTIDYGTGAVTFGTAPAAGVKITIDYKAHPGFTDTTGFVNLMAMIAFSVDSRGTSPLHFANLVFTDKYFATSTPIATDGFFDNRLDGTMSVPHIIDTSLNTPGSFFDVYVSVGPWFDKDISSLWGFQFVLSYDPNIIQAFEYEIVADNGEGIPFMAGPSELGMDYAAVTGNSYYGDNVGLSTAGLSVPVARIGFVVVGVGVTSLTLHDTLMVDVYGNTLVHDTFSGSFANANLSVSLNSVFVESHKWSLSMDGNLFTVTEQFTNTGDGPTMARAHFMVFKGAMKVADITTDPVYIMPGEILRVSTKLDLTGFLPGHYVVEGTVEYINSLAEWVTGQKGSPTGNKTTAVKSFKLLP